MRTKARIAAGLPPSIWKRPLEPCDPQERIVVGRIGVAAPKLLANDLLRPADAEPLGRGDGADRRPSRFAGRAGGPWGDERTGFAGAGMGFPFG
jgi:hypothetical protein